MHGKPNYRDLEQRRLGDSHEPVGEVIRQDGRRAVPDSRHHPGTRHRHVLLELRTLRRHEQPHAQHLGLLRPQPRNIQHRRDLPRLYRNGGFRFREAGARDHPHHPARNRHPDLSEHRPDESAGQGGRQTRQDGRRPAGLYIIDTEEMRVEVLKKRPK